MDFSLIWIQLLSNLVRCTYYNLIFILNLSDRAYRDFSTDPASIETLNFS